MTPIYQPICEACDEQGIERQATDRSWGRDLCAGCAAVCEDAHQRDQASDGPPVGWEPSVYARVRR
ncbi:MAG: hypothetical protein RL409_2656 [Gemmatimonadota bacterium]|jgi:hypothetical protein